MGASTRISAVICIAAIALLGCEDERTAACRAIERAAAHAADRLIITGRLSSADVGMFADAVAGYAIAMRRGPEWSAATIESALKDRAGARYLNRELWFMSPADEHRIGVSYGDYGMGTQEARAVLELLTRRFAVHNVCKKL
jgi:hypothetical protein